jgi:hypothetical protein
VKSPVAEIVPTNAFPPAIPFTFQFTDWFAALLTVALNSCEDPSAKLALVGAIATVTVVPPAIVT